MSPHSFGRIRASLIRTPCRSLDRKIYPVTLDGGAVVAVSVVWVGFRAKAQAADFRRLHKIHGNGDIAPLGAALLGLGDITFTALNYGSRVSGTSVVIAETEAALGSVDGDVLGAVAEVAIAFPKR